MEDSCYYDILKSESYGRYAVSSKDLEPGDLIVTEPPFTYGPKSDSQPVCLGCLCEVDGKYFCSVCGWPVCNQSCEKLPVHSENECIIFSKVKIKFTPVKDLTLSCPQYECIMPLRVLLAKERNEAKWDKEIKLMESHCEKRRKTELWEVEEVNVVGFLHKICKLQQRFPSELIHFVCGVLDVNAFIAPAAYGSEMRCLYPKSSLFTHSCVPNVGHYIFSENNRIYVRAMVRIKKGEELFLTYTQTLSPTYFRRAHLKEGKFFDCTCQRCSDPTELQTNLSTLKCLKCNDGLILSTNPLDNTAPWKCTLCECITGSEEIISTLYCIQKEATELQFLENTDPVTCRENFIKKYSRVLHPNHAILMSVKSSLSQLYGKAKGYLLESAPDSLLQRKIDLCYEIDKISNIIKPGISRQRGWNLYELHSLVIILAKSQFRQKKIDEKHFRLQLQTATKYLEEVALIFSYEDPNSPEGITGKNACRVLKDLNIFIKSLPQ